jgi:hypothetical protein
MRPTLAVVLLFWTCLSGYGATILTSPSEFSPGTSLVGFEAFPNGATVPIGAAILSNQWQPWGFLISDSSPQDGAAASGGTLTVPPHRGQRAISDSNRDTPGGFIEFRFVFPVSGAPATVTEAGIWVQNGDQGSTVDFFDAQGNLLQSITTVGQDFFAGLRAMEGIARMRITDEGFYLVDDLQYTPVPEPGGLALAVIAVCALCWRRRK